MLKSSLICVIYFLICVSCVYAADESLTITTYYPSPYGSYREVSAYQMKIGKDYSDASYSVSENNLIVQGNVGIGTAGPGTNLHLSGAKNTNMLKLQFTATAFDDYVGIDLARENTVLGNIKTRNGPNLGGSLDFATHEDDNLPGNAPTVRMTIDYNGNVGINTANPQGPLNVLGSIYLEQQVSSGAGSYGLTFSDPDDRIEYASIYMRQSDNSLNIATYEGPWADRITITRDGRVGIRTANPSVPLDVQGSVWNAWANGNVGLNVAGDIATGGSIRIPGSGRVGIGTNDPAVPLDVRGCAPNAFYEGAGCVGLNVAGDIGTGQAFRGPYFRQFTSGQYNPSTGTYVGINAAADILTGQCLWARNGGARYCDISEYIHMRQAENIEPGDVVVIDDKKDGQLKLSTQEYDTTVAGVVSSKETATLIVGSPEGGKELLALAGQLKVKATTINGPIKRGDLLTTSSIPGSAMKATDKERCVGAILGKALESLEQGEGKILVLLTLQ